MQTQTYFHTVLESYANRCNNQVPLQVNCTGTVGNAFSSRSIRKDYYYIYVTQGRMVMPEQTLKAGDVMILEPETVYQYRSEGETVYYWVHYTGYEAGGISQRAVGKLNVKRSVGIHQEIVDCFQKLFREFIIHDETAEQMTPMLLREILLYTERFVKAGEKKGAPLIALEYIHGHYREEILVEALAELEHMGCTAFRSAFKAHTGVSPNDYIINQRISEASHLLTQTEMPVRDIAFAVGYGDQYYFSRIYKKKMGVTPLKYRRVSREQLHMGPPI